MNPYESTRQEVPTLPRTRLGILLKVAIWCLPIILPIIAAFLTRFGLFGSTGDISIFSGEFLFFVTFVSPIAAMFTNAASRYIMNDSVISVASIAHTFFCVACGFFFRWMIIEMASSI